MSSWPLIKYVDSPSAAAVVRYDFNDQTPNPATGPAKKVTAFDPGVPTVEGDPDAVGQSWGFRSPSITHTIKGTKAQAMAALSAVSKEQLRRINWVLFQPSAAQQPVWFKTYRTNYQPISLDQVFVRVSGGGQAPLPDTWRITVPLVADAFTYGARVALGPYTVTQAPSGTNPMKVALPAIKGDAPTNLRIQISPGSQQKAAPQSKWLIGCVSGDATLVDPVRDIGTGDGFNTAGGTGAVTTDAAYFGGSYRPVTIAAATPNLLNRGSIALAAMPIGRYQILLRCVVSSVTARTLLVRGRQIAGGGIAGAQPDLLGTTAAIPLAAGESSRVVWSDLGTFSFPFGVQVPLDGVGTTSSYLFGIDLGYTDGLAGTVNIDALKVLPIDGRAVTSATILKATGPAPTPLDLQRIGTFDGDDEVYWARDVSSGVLYEGAPQLAGSFPTADPAASQNLLEVIALDDGYGLAGYSLTGTSTIAAVNATAVVTPSYYPRFLHVGDGT